MGVELLTDPTSVFNGESWVPTSFQDWACEPAELQAAEEDEQPKVAVRRLILETRSRLRELEMSDVEQLGAGVRTPTPKGNWGREMGPRLVQGNLSWWIFIIWPD